MKFLMLIVSVFFFISGFSQQVNEDSIANVQVKNAVAVYNQYTDGNAAVYNGAQYMRYTFKMEGDPYFLSNDFTQGWVSYEGRRYDSLSVLYDIARNEVVILYTDGYSDVVLENDFIDSFNMAGHTFVKLQEDHGQNLYNSGFYDELYNGKTSLIARRVKKMDEVIRNEVTRRFFETDRFYVRKNGLYYWVSNKKDVFKLFSNKKRDIKKMLSKQHLKMKRSNFENVLTRVVAFYDQLT